jgi:hypothetical protein
VGVDDLGVGQYGGSDGWVRGRSSMSENTPDVLADLMRSCEVVVGGEFRVPTTGVTLLRAFNCMERVCALNSDSFFHG